MSACLALEWGNAHREDAPQAVAPSYSSAGASARLIWGTGWERWKRLGTFRPSLAPGVGFVPSPGEWHQLTASRNRGWEEGRADLPAGRGKTGSWQVPLLLPEETRSEEAMLRAGGAKALSQGFHAHWVERPGRGPKISSPNTSKAAHSRVGAL